MFCLDKDLNRSLLEVLNPIKTSRYLVSCLNVPTWRGSIACLSHEKERIQSSKLM